MDQFLKGPGTDMVARLLLHVLHQCYRLVSFRPSILVNLCNLNQRHQLEQDGKLATAKFVLTSARKLTFSPSPLTQTHT